MKTAVRAKWLEALRGGTYAQGRQRLRAEDSDDLVQRFCCLGVLCDLVEPDLWSKGPELVGSDDEVRVSIWSHRFESCEEFPSQEVLDRAGIQEPTAHALARMNDGGASFDAIANWIEENL